MGDGVPVGAGPVINRRTASGALLGRCCVAAPRWAGHVVIRDDWWTHRLQRPVGGVSPKGVGAGWQEAGGGEHKQGVQQLKNRGSDASLLVNIPICRIGCRRSGASGVRGAEPGDSLYDPGAQLTYWQSHDPEGGMAKLATANLKNE